MSLSKLGWSLNDKHGNEPSGADRESIEKLPRHLLFPYSGDILSLEMPKKRTAPREMNSFIIFRRHLAQVAKEAALSDDGKNLSRFASYIWHGASQSERQGYADIADKLKQRHYERYPTYTYERRKRKTNDGDFIVNTPATLCMRKKKKVKNNNNNNTLSIPVSVEEPFPVQQSDVYSLYDPIPIPTQPQEPEHVFATDINNNNNIYVQNIPDAQTVQTVQTIQTIQDDQTVQNYNNLNNLYSYPYHVLPEFFISQMDQMMLYPDCGVDEVNVFKDNVLDFNIDMTLQQQPTFSYQAFNNGDVDGGFYQDNLLGNAWGTN